MHNQHEPSIYSHATVNTPDVNQIHQEQPFLQALLAANLVKERALPYLKNPLLNTKVSHISPSHTPTSEFLYILFNNTNDREIVAGFLEDESGSSLLFSSPEVQTGSGVHPDSYPMVIWGAFSAVKAARTWSPLITSLSSRDLE
jgi:hypothetical protein